MVFTSGNIEFSQTNPEKAFNLFTYCFSESHIRNLFAKIHNRITTIICEIFSKLTIKIPERRHGLVSLLLTLNIFHTFSSYH